MAVKAKAGLSGTIRKESVPKTTSIGYGARSRPGDAGRNPLKAKDAKLKLWLSRPALTTSACSAGRTTASRCSSKTALTQQST
jgi:hypothetical protein